MTDPTAGIHLPTGFSPVLTIQDSKGGKHTIYADEEGDKFLQQTLQQYEDLSRAVLQEVARQRTLVRILEATQWFENPDPIQQAAMNESLRSILQHLSTTFLQEPPCESTPE